MTADDPVVDVVILTWNDGPLLDAAVASVRSAVGVRANLIVVDNGSAPPAVVDGPVTLLRNEANVGVAPGRNQGVRAGRADVVCLLDSDAQLRPASLRALVAALEGDDRVGLVAPVFEGQSADASGGRAPGLGRKVLRALGVTDRYSSGAAWRDGVRDVDFAIGACQVFRRSAFEAVGGLDETYFYGPEDVDLCLRLRLAGWRVRQVDTPVLHPPRRRNRRLLTRRGVAHARAVLRHVWRHRAFHRSVPA